MARRSSSFLAALLVALVVAVVCASASVPRCAEDGSHIEAKAYPAVLKGALTYSSDSCEDGQPAIFDIVARNSAPATMVKLDNWNFIVALRDDQPAVYTLDARCGTRTICEAEVTFSIKQ